MKRQFVVLAVAALFGMGCGGAVDDTASDTPEATVEAFSTQCGDITCGGGQVCCAPCKVCAASAQACRLIVCNPL
jgi:hypothetical protein